MKKLTKIKLINWHIFHNVTIPVKNDMLIFGDNGTGKSTLLDGVLYVITGGNTAFNTAANINAKRTLEGYVRGKLGFEQKKYLRSGKNVVSHIALEFFDEREQAPFVIGVCLEIRDNSNKVDARFYSIFDAQIKDEFYFDVDKEEKYPYFFLEFDRKMSAYDLAYQRIEGSKRDIQRTIERILSLSGKYYELLPKALAFKPIDDVNQFVFDFLLDEDPINIENVRKTIQAYREIEAMIKNEKAKLELLQPIVSNYDQIEKEVKEQKMFEALLNNNKLEKENEKLIINKKQLSANEKINTEYEKTITVTDDRINELKLMKSNIEKSDGYTLVAEKNNELMKSEIALKNANLEINKLNSLLLSEQNVINKLSLSQNLTKHISVKNFNDFQNDIREYKEMLAEHMHNNEFELKEVINDIKKHTDTQKNVENEYIQLKKGINTYSDAVKSLKDLIQEQILKVKLVEAKIKPLCELIDLNDDAWRDALEGVLGNKRFDLFVESKYYDIALDVYYKNKEKFEIYSVGIINSGEINKMEAAPNTLATKIETGNLYVRAHINTLLGNIVCAKTVQELEEYNAAVTPFVMVKENNTIRQINPRYWERPFIGHSSKIIRLTKLEEELKELRETISKLEEDKRLISNTLNIIKTESKIDFLLHVTDVWEQKNVIIERIDQLETDIKRLEKDGFAKQLADLNEIELDIAKMIEDRDELRTKSRILIGKNAQLENSISSSIDIIDKLNAEIGNIILKNNLTDYELQVFFKENASEDNDILQKLRSLEDETAAKKSIIVNQMATYKQKHAFDAMVNISAINEYLTEYRNVKDRNLIDLENTAAERSKLMDATFKEDYLQKMRSKIENANDAVKRLNKVLGNRPFGNKQEVYQFIISRNKDELFGKYYDIFVSGQEFNVTSLFESSLTLENQELIRDLMSRLVADDNAEAQEKRLIKYTDYRNFMSYDIKITNANNDVIYFSKTNREKSGGETQTPFYVIIAASFEQIMKSSGGPYNTSSSATLVILDEAFDKMDESRIEAMVDYFGKLNIQVIISVPPLRAVTIYEYVDTVISLSNHNNQAIPYITYRGGLHE